MSASRQSIHGLGRSGRVAVYPVTNIKLLSRHEFYTHNGIICNPAWTAQAKYRLPASGHLGYLGSWKYEAVFWNSLFGFAHKLLCPRSVSSPPKCDLMRHSSSHFSLLMPNFFLQTFCTVCLWHECRRTEKKFVYNLSIPVYRHWYSTNRVLFRYVGIYICYSC